MFSQLKNLFAFNQPHYLINLTAVVNHKMTQKPDTFSCGKQQPGQHLEKKNNSAFVYSIKTFPPI